MGHALTWLATVLAAFHFFTARCDTAAPRPPLAFSTELPHRGWYNTGTHIVYVNPKRTPKHWVRRVVGHEVGHWCNQMTGAASVFDEAAATAWAERVSALPVRS